MDDTRVFIIGRKSMCVEGLAAILTGSGRATVIGRASEWSDGVARAKGHGADVVVVDMVHCPECGPPTPLACVKELEGTSVVIMGAPGGDTTVVDALEAGAIGFLSLDHAEPDAVVATVLAAARGEASIDPRVTSSVLTRMRRLSRAASSAGPRDLQPTDREGEVLELLVEGCSNREIATRLHVSESTVKNHLHTIYSKLGVDSRAQAVSEAMRRGLVER